MRHDRAPTLRRFGQCVVVTLSPPAVRWVIFTGVAAATVFTAFPRLDLVVSALFFRADSGFVMKGHPVGDFFDREVNQVARLFAFSLVPLYFAGLVRKRAIFGLDTRRFGVILAGMVLGTTLIVNEGLKEHWGRARPDEVVAFGGEARFTPAFVPADQCATNCSFVSGHAAFAFSFLALALGARRYRAWWVFAVMSYAVMVSAMRVMRGAHFLSDVVMAGVIIVLIVLIAERLIVEKAWEKKPPG